MTSGSRKRWFLVAGALVVLAAATFAGVRWKSLRDAATIRTEHQALFAALPPATVPTPCPDSDRRQVRFTDARGLLEASSRRAKFDDPLSPALVERLRAVELAGRGADFACLLRSVEIGSPSFAALGALAALLFDKADLLLATGDARSAWALVAEALELYDRPVGFQYLHYFSAYNFLRRAARMTATAPPDPAWRPRLRAAARAATMTRADFCAGLREELAALATLHFYAHVEADRAAFVARWGEKPIASFEGSGLPQRRRSLSTWRRYLALARPLGERCVMTPLPDLERDARPALGALAADDRELGFILDATVQRIGHFGQLEAAGGALATALAD